MLCVKEPPVPETEATTVEAATAPPPPSKATQKISDEVVPNFIELTTKMTPTQGSVNPKGWISVQGGFNQSTIYPSILVIKQKQCTIPLSL